MSIIKEWREIARNCPNILTQKLIKDICDALQDTIPVFALEPTADRLQTINSLWARGERYVSTATQIPDPIPPTAGAGRGEVELQRIAA